MTVGEKSILIVDDDADFVESTACFLAANHFRVLKARDGRQGLQLAKREHPDLILMDVMMDERTEGFFTVQEMRRDRELKDVPIFMLSALYEKAPDFAIVPERGWAAHDEFLAKPVDMTQLLEKIRRRIGEPQ
jgi:DNA-binding response OmpR family regulator